MKEERISLYRFIPIAVIFGMTIAISCGFCLYQQLYLDEWICVLVLDVIFLCILLFELEYERKHKMIANNAATTFARVAGGFTICCLITILFLFIPEFFRPFIFLSLIMCALGNESIGIFVGLYLNFLFCITSSGNYYEILSSCILILLGGILAKALDEPRFRIYISFLFFLLSILIPCLFYYFSYKEMYLRNYLYAFVGGIITFVIAQFGYPRWKKDTYKEVDNRLNDILSEDYPPIRDLKKFYPSEYAHALRVSDIAVRCAKELGFRVSLCEAGGFYYRLGRWQGEPSVSSGVKKAQELCFPIELIDILKEYYGEEKIPHSPESALIHMIDSLTKKMDAMKQDVGGSQWNREMVIYQTLNNYSTEGLYDKCGMSMNQFLKVREFMVKEKLLR